MALTGVVFEKSQLECSFQAEQPMVSHINDDDEDGRTVLCCVAMVPYRNAAGVNIITRIETQKQPRPGCSKLTTSLVNETLKIQMLISQICQYFLLKKCEKLSGKTLNELTS